MKNRHKTNWIKGLVWAVLCVVVLGGIAAGIIFDGRETKTPPPSTSSAKSEFGFDVSNLPPEMRAHAEECHRKGMGAGRRTNWIGHVTAIKCYEE